jgi:hypothetical protein
MFSSRTAPPSTTPETPAVPRDSSPTWELEMLVSGAVLFSLFQRPPLLHGLYARWDPLGAHAVRAGRAGRLPRALEPYVIPFWL